ncbi:MAG: IMP cyclohydrolase [Eubacteriales bacterium]|nr:IMP cyclohydrolase [Eubacteriales bacterium]
MAYADPYEIRTMAERNAGNPYVGRGIAVGFTKNMKKAVLAYFIMGRSANSRNRIFLKTGDDVMIKPFDASKVEDPSLIIYYPVRTKGKQIIVTNGDQTDTVADEIDRNGVKDAFDHALLTRKFEPDPPNFTPRISAMLDLSDASHPGYEISILKSGDPYGKTDAKFFFHYDGNESLGHFIHTYITDGNPIPTFTGEPERVSIPEDIDAFTNEIWDSIDAENKVSLYVRYTDVKTGKYESRLINKNK